MDTSNSQNSPANPKHQSAADLARKKVLAVYSSAVKNLKRKSHSDKKRPYEQIMPESNTQTTSYSNPPANWQASTNDLQTSQDAASTTRQPLYSSSSDTNNIAPGPAQPENAFTDYDSVSNFNSVSTNVQDPARSVENQPYSNQEFYSSQYNDSYAHQNAKQQPDSTGNTEELQSSNYASDSQSSNVERSIPENGSAYDSQSDQRPSKAASADNTQPVTSEWKKYHAAWQEYYQKYYNDYYAKAAQTYLATEKLKDRRIAAGKDRQVKKIKHLIPLGVIILLILAGLFLQYNRMIFAPVMAYISPNTDQVAESITPVDPNVSQTVSPEPRLIIPKINVDVPVAFDIPLDDVDNAMNEGVAQFSIPGANAMPGQVGNLVISGHSAGDIYSSNPYKFIFSGLERLEVGDLIYINYQSVRYTYQMTGEQTVEPTDVNALIYPTDKPILTLITCTPLGTSRYRLLITAEQINPEFDPTNGSEANSATNEGVTMPANSPTLLESIFN